ncbi:type II secretion system protein [bacterium]|nr:type II secretion system protein [bacterium]
MGALGLNLSEDAVLGSREKGGISLKSSQGADFALKDKGALGSKVNEDAVLGLGVKNLRNRRSLLVPLRGFTLAEVLITLGIIGVVAALTIPTLMQEHRKHVVETKLKEGHSVLSNAYEMLGADYGLNYERERFAQKDANEALEMLNKYYAPYIKFVKTEAGTKGAIGKMINGSAVYLYRHGDIPSSTNTWNNVFMFICVDYDSCIQLDSESTPNYFSEIGKKVFITTTSGQVPVSWFSGKTNSELISSCTGAEKGACTALIFNNGWKIPDDYPFKF